MIVGAGFGGLVAAAILARAGREVTVLEASDRIGGKARSLHLAGREVSTGPTVLTLKPIVEAAFEEAGGRLDEVVRMTPLEVLARHGWADGSRLDLFADTMRSASAVEALAGTAEAEGYLRFLDHVRRIFAIVEGPFILAERPRLAGLLEGDWRRLLGLARIDAGRSLHASLRRFFRDRRLLQVFGRYATYAGGSPYLAPATFGLIAHVEASGVYRVSEGLEAVAAAFADRARASGARIRIGAPVAEVAVAGGRARGVRLDGGERIEAETVLVAADVAAVATGRFGAEAARAVGRRAAPRRRERSLSAVTVAAVAEAHGFPLSHHNVFFGPDDRDEFEALFGARRMPSHPTVYVCAPDRGADGAVSHGAERLLCITNAPAEGDAGCPDQKEEKRWLERTQTTLYRAGLILRPVATAITTPRDFARRYPATGGALYGAAPHGAMAAFARRGAKTRLPGLYLAGGSVHPGAGVPMAIQSGRNAAWRILRDQASDSPSPRVAMAGGTSTW